MRVRDRVGLNLSPLLLRVMLGSIFLWLGLTKVLGTFEVDGTNAAVLANMGVITPASATPAKPATPEKPAATEPPATPAPTAPEKPAEEKKPGTQGRGADHEYNVRLVHQTGGTPADPKFKSSDFPKPVKVRKLYVTALAIKGASAPGAMPDGTPKSSYWPAALADGKWPVYLAWGGAIGEVLAGVALALGLLTRLGALLVAARMAGALWVTQFGPAIASGDAVLGFLPAHDAFDVEHWRPLMLQFALLFSALALMFLGPGRASLDHAIFASPRRDEHDDDDDAE